jgi:mRNA interferase MazF
MARILRGNIYWADLNPVIGSEQGGLRPVLILSHNVFNERSGTVIAVALTSKPQRARFPLILELKDPKLPKRSWVKISQIRTLSVKRIRKRIAIAAEEELVSVIDGLNEIIGG